MAKKSSKVFLIVSLSIVGLVILAGAAVSIFYKPYMAVYLVTGDMYFGKTNVFPCVKIQDPWFLQRAEDGSLTLEKFTDAIWAPENGMKINRKHIIFISKLSESSPIIAAIEERGTSQQILAPIMGTDSEAIETDSASTDIED
jgi:hypothetical protein